VAGASVGASVIGASVGASVIGASVTGGWVAGASVTAGAQADNASVAIVRTAMKLYHIFLDIFSSPYFVSNSYKQTAVFICDLRITSFRLNTSLARK
jgi:hypothetical protein